MSLFDVTWDTLNLKDNLSILGRDSPYDSFISTFYDDQLQNFCFRVF